MLLNIFKFIILLIQTINQSICVDLNNITYEDINTLEREYPNFHHVYLEQHPHYIKSHDGENFCPVPYSHAVEENEIPYEGIEIINRKLKYVVMNCVDKENYKLAYTIFLNAIESMIFTFMYRFCECAIEMNKRGAEISFNLKVFSNKLTVLIPIINREWISPEPYECILDVYKKYEKKNNKYKFKKENENEDYRNDLLGCMNLMKDKVHFLREPDNLSTNEMNVNELEEYLNKNDNVINYQLTFTQFSPYFKCITGDKYQTSCITCNGEHSDISSIYVFAPCGHGWRSKYCKSELTKCPACHEEVTNNQHLNIATFVSIVTKEYNPLPPRCIMDERKIRCVLCRNQIIDDVHNSKRHIMIPCGHGWYCSKCIKEKKCSLCSKKKTNKLCVKLKKQ
ncbi:uncharacterized protein LOC126894366 [Daktulosphaira vitifoliae]|uniref:uncharacterized protein LOC126894366 n=1 Tax=Daktulosphaira vitifoliae TaxID=58002 RepID=UPI0021A9D239|nr:uncharacterized protein LOC126894366 [Daktulosphaira vitifoliae]